MLSQLRTLRGAVISLNDIRYIDPDFITSLETEIAENSEKIAQRCVQFLLDEKALLPYHQRVTEKEEALKAIKKVIEAKKLETSVNAIATDLEMLIDIVSNLQIEDTSHSTKIIDNISLIFAKINQLKAGIKTTITSLGGKEATAEFAAQLKLVDQSIINYLDIARTPEKTDELLNKVSVQLEDLEGRFADFDVFITQIIEKREEVYNAFEARKNSLIEARNKKTIALENAAIRILKGVQKKALSFDTVMDINGYFAADLMINKLRDIVQQLQVLGDIGKSESIETAIKVAKEDATRKLKDKQELYEDGENIIKLGKHKFGVNQQPLDLTIVYKSNQLCYHLTGTDFYEKITDPILVASKKYWTQELISENDHVYRSSYLAYTIFCKHGNSIRNLGETEVLALVQAESSQRFSEGYIKGVHDLDAAQIVTILSQKDHDLGLLKYTPNTRAFARYFWESLAPEQQSYWNEIIKASGEVLTIFPESNTHTKILKNLEKAIDKSAAIPWEKQPKKEMFSKMAQYLFEELQENNSFCWSQTGKEGFDDFVNALKKKKVFSKLQKKLQQLKNDTSGNQEQINLAEHWITSFLQAQQGQAQYNRSLEAYVHEISCMLLFPDTGTPVVIHVNPNHEIKGLKGGHATIKDTHTTFNYYQFIAQLEAFTTNEVPAFEAYRAAKHTVTERLKNDLKLAEFKPRVLSSFVRNKLIDQVYLPLFGDNLSKQLGSLGDNKRTDRMGMLLLVSPPGYGKTTLMEYMANRLGLVFMKINGPAVGHEVTSVDPMAATNASAKEELKKLNLAFEMGNNVMLYLDDIQHCNPEFLQKFISLADGTRKIEGVYNGKPKTYNLRSKKFCIIMAGNPYTERGEKFQIPDMLANRADIYNLGDIIGDSAALFKLSLIENSLTSNPILQQLSNKHFDDLYQLINIVESGSQEWIHWTKLPP